jgi:hypothetical protein
METDYTTPLIFATLTIIVIGVIWLVNREDKKELEEFYKKFPKYDPRIKKEKSRRPKGKQSPGHVL